MHGGFGFGSRNKEGERLLEFGTATDMVAIIFGLTSIFHASMGWTGYING